MTLNKSLFKKPNIPLEGGGEERELVTCPKCDAQIPPDKLNDNLNVCPFCEHHFRMSARERIAMLCGEGSFAEFFSDLSRGNPIDFPEYESKLSSARKRSGELEAVICGQGEIEGVLCAIFVMEGAFMMGSMGTAVGEKITRLFEYALEKRLPVVGVTVSGGARMQEGILSLMQMAKVSAAVARHSAAKLLYIALLTDPTTGGVTASFAMEADIILAEPGALVAFAGPRVIEQTIRKKLPAGFQRAEMLMDKGFVDKIVPRLEQREILSFLLSAHGRGHWHAGI